MKKIIGYIRDFFRYQCSVPYLITIVLYTALLVFINFRFDFEERFIKPDPGDMSRVLKYIGMYTCCFAVPYFLQLFFRKTRASVKAPQLWLLLFFGIIIFSIRCCVFQHSDFVQRQFPPEYQIIAYKYAVNLAGFVFLFIPCFILWLFIDRKHQPPYGLHSKGVNLKPYFGLLLFMLPLLLWAAQQQDFQDTYPRAEHLYLGEGMPHKNLLVALYELCYSIDFGVIEFFFRGFLILALVRYAGANVILPMCVFYVSIHFDKPLAECISSFFGGLILGVLTYNTRSIYGGIIVHLGIALMMEVLGFVF